MAIVVADTGPIRYLVQIEYIGILPDLVRREDLHRLQMILEMRGAQIRLDRTDVGDRGLQAFRRDGVAGQVEVGDGGRIEALEVGRALFEAMRSALRLAND